MERFEIEITEEQKGSRIDKALSAVNRNGHVHKFKHG